MRATEWLSGKYIYLFVLVLLLLLSAVIYVFYTGNMDVESAKVYLQALTAVATLALLYYAYYNVASKREEDVARLELAVRPIFLWELESSDGGASLVYKSVKHPIYDLRMRLELCGREFSAQERHLDVSDEHAAVERRLDVTAFVSDALGKEKEGTLCIHFSYHSEVGGKYEFSFTKEVVRKKNGFLFQHRKIVSAKYPWRGEMVLFGD